MKGIVIHLLRLEALSEGRLSVLRVPAKWFPAPDCVWCKGHGYEWIDADPSGYDYRRPCRCIKPPYAPGDYFVRETWTTRCPIWDGDQRESFFVNAIVDPSTIIYRADDPTVKRMWRSSVTMPEWASRYLMTLGPPVPGRLGEVTMEIAIAEGWDCTIHCDYYDEWYLKTWSQIYGKKHPWLPDLWTWGYPVTWRKR
jgi:hypothetical protein